jgi:hypothetical protein
LPEKHEKGQWHREQCIKGRKVVLCLLCSLEHVLKSTALMGPVERLNNAVIWEAITKPREEAGVIHP